MMTPLTDYVSSNKWSIKTEMSQIDELFYMIKFENLFFLINRNLFF